MQNKQIKIGATIVVVCLALCGTFVALGLGQEALLGVPFLPLAAGLRWLSLSGALGNGVAIALYLAVCLAPLVWLVVRLKNKRAFWADALLAVFSALLFVGLYLLINPGLLVAQMVMPELAQFAPAMVAVALHSVWVSYAILRLLRAVSAQEVSTEKNLQYLRWLLFGMMAVLLVSVVLVGGLALAESIKAFQAQNTANVAGKGISICFLVVQHLAAQLPSALEIWVLGAGAALVRQLQNGLYGEGVVAAAKTLGKVCRISVCAILLCQVGVNVLQLVLVKHLLSTSYTLSVPLGAIGLVLAALLLADYLQQACQLKAENDLFV